MSNPDNSKADGRQRIAVVTGASGGMGLATARMLASEHGMKVYLLARSLERGTAALENVKRCSKRDDPELILCDLGSMEQIRRAAEEIRSRCTHIDVLVNNAGVLTLRREETEDGFERQLGVNHLGHFVLTRELLPLLSESRQGRIVIVSSAIHKFGKMNYNDPHMKRRYTMWGAYGRSKLANLWFMKELHERLKESRVTVNAVHPGAVSTQIGVNRSTGFGTFVHRMVKPFFLTPEQGADTAVYLASSPEVAGMSGLYFYKRKPAKISAKASSPELANRFWEWSEEVTGYRDQPKPVETNVPTTTGSFRINSFR
ncbi:SDR family oxidoreductase [Paenibacillus physcomitrellae]|uniref:Short-chain dehydrogenase n=1 Tax=Paenibacillus physcomitrellae TaxID=1619311 RepID=A0ABQ1GFG5_9BACL|nr:SDR family oxidoreductase [Paenibacillus physcomitrellae]GGA42808.1 short-chain dehydrogenase [Paenibacillus physcomitrellae]